VSGLEPTALLGRWQLTRQIVDEGAGLSGTASGELTMLDEDDHLLWREQGTLLWNGLRLPFTRAYRLRRVDDRWWVYFEDGRPFHLWRPGNWVEHPCSEDVYRGLITIAGPDAWQTDWELRGPTKQQRITTQFSRPKAAD
jgi:hypothetical protein